MVNVGYGNVTTVVAVVHLPLGIFTILLDCLLPGKLSVDHTNVDVAPESITIGRPCMRCKFSMHFLILSFADICLISDSSSSSRVSGAQ